MLKPNYASRFLWWLYGFTYDGLLTFYPYQKLRDIVIKKSEVKKNDRVLDLGCGTGNYLEKLQYLTEKQLTGVDISGSMLTVAKKKLKNSVESKHVALYQNDILQFLKSQPTGAFDCVISVNVIYALNNRDELWKELLRVISKSGRLIAATAVHTGRKNFISEQLRQVGLLKSLRPKLLGVLIIDSLIDLFGFSGTFAFPDEKTLRDEIVRAGGCMSESQSAYSDVAIIFIVTH